MSTHFNLTLFESPYVDGFASISALDDGVGTAVADPHWHMMIMRLDGKMRIAITGPLTRLSTKAHREGTEYIGIRFKVGTYMPHLPVANLVDRGMVLPQATSKSFWLYGSAWEFPTHNNVDVFVERLARQGIVVREPIVASALQGQLPDVSSRSIQRRFLQATGLPQRSLYQIERAQQAMCCSSRARQSSIRLSRRATSISPISHGRLSALLVKRLRKSRAGVSPNSSCRKRTIQHSSPVLSCKGQVIQPHTAREGVLRQWKSPPK